MYLTSLYHGLREYSPQGGRKRRKLDVRDFLACRMFLHHKNTHHFSMCLSRLVSMMIFALTVSKYVAVVDARRSLSCIPIPSKGVFVFFFSGSSRSRRISCSIEGRQHVHLTSRKRCLNKTRNDKPFCQPTRRIQDFKGRKVKTITLSCGAIFPISYHGI